MNKDLIYKYAPAILMFIAIILQYNLFVTPEKLEHTNQALKGGTTDGLQTI